ncbi:HIT family protein [Bradyrhizobium sp. KB893862 SZCCT0404]|uniref:HIT family protein n=1 Tax=Bradyrhizobium sp. KB893862 SZCCT0404 TaxID=2807672 RepID=UPI001BABCD04|nr:HIT family protein [Bradyrhizobium sp. KB893862 SZCCT0404]MBR1175364.1 HIT family protein [Bradyrhizobium sp. KB893862 SZCCT0404]
MSSNQDGSPAASGWNLDERWEARISGTSCEFCRWDEAIRATYPVEVARLRVSRWFLGANQYVRGYSILVLDRHAIELYDLDTTVRQAFTEDMADAGQALGRVLKPIKMNFELLGNVVPHLHCHLKPRHRHDRPAHARIFQDAQREQMPLTQLEQLAGELRLELRR